MGRKANELRDLELTEISLVDKGANHGARVVLMKRDVSKMIKEENGKFCVYSEDGKKMGEHDTMAEAMAQMKAMEEHKDMKKGLFAKIAEVLGLKQDADDELAVELEKAGKKISAARMAKIKEMYRMLHDMIMEQEPEDEKEETMKTDVKTLPADVQELIADLQKKADAPNQDAIQKMVNDAVAKVKTEADAAIKKAQDEAAAAAAATLVEKDARITKEYEGKVAVFKNLPIKAEDAKIMKAVDEKLSKEDAARVWELLKGADEVLKSANIMHKQIGSAAGDSGSGDAVEKANEMADALVAKDAKLSKTDALAKVFKENPKLYDDYKQAVAVRV